MQLLELSENERKAIFLETASQIGIRPDMVEKDFWVTWTLNRLFQDPHIASVLLFKGGTSLSKAFQAINRFSEDIDLLLDLREVSDIGETFKKERSRNAVNTFKQRTARRTSRYITSILLPEIQECLSPVCSVVQDSADANNLYVTFPTSFASINYIRPNIKLEIGAFAEGTPFAPAKIQSYVSEKIPLLTEKTCAVPTVSITRTFWEKITILHYLHFLPEDRATPLRHSRHLYDIFMLCNSRYKDDIFAASALLNEIIAFDRKYYEKRGINYDEMNLHTLQLLPSANRLADLQNDYTQMADMIFGEKPTWNELLETLAQLEDTLHHL